MNRGDLIRGPPAGAAPSDPAINFEKGEYEPMKKLCMCLLLALALAGTAQALEAPDQTVVQNLNGRQELIRTYTLAPGEDPASLIEAPFERECFLYTFSDVAKQENHAVQQQFHTETVTVETAGKDLRTILAELPPTMEYKEDGWTGALVLDHTTLQTQAAGYASKSQTLTETKTIGPVDRNDMSYVPATTVKDGRTLNLVNVEWQVIGTDMVGDVLAPSSYQAVATYTGQNRYSVATGYVTTASYMGEVSREEVESVTYRLTYLGTEIVEPEPQEDVNDRHSGLFTNILPWIIGGAGAAAVVGVAVFLAVSQRQAQTARIVYREEGEQ